MDTVIGLMMLAMVAGYLCGRWHGVLHERDTLRTLAKAERLDSPTDDKEVY